MKAHCGSDENIFLLINRLGTKICRAWRRYPGAVERSRYLRENARKMISTFIFYYKLCWIFKVLPSLVGGLFSWHSLFIPYN